MEITFYSTDYTKSLPIVPGKYSREWIEKIPGQPYYKDLSMTMANESGWEFRAPGDFTIEWNGGEKSNDLCVHSFMNDAHLFYTGMGNGICSIRAGYVVKTPDDYAILCSGAPNFYKENIVPLTSVIESNWAHMTFFLNWKMLNPGKVTFKKGEPIGFVTIIPHRQLENFEMKIDTIMDDPVLYERFKLWQEIPIDCDPYLDGVENSQTMEKTNKFHIKERSLPPFKGVDNLDYMKYNDGVDDAPVK
jgi:hypothetical protein